MYNVMALADAVLNPTIQASITSGMTETQSMVTAIIGLVFGGIVAIICLSGGANFALRKIRSVFSWA